MTNIELFNFAVWAKDRYPTFLTDPKVYQEALEAYTETWLTKE